jgi:hypothetical protein
MREPSLRSIYSGALCIIMMNAINEAMKKYNMPKSTNFDTLDFFQFSLTILQYYLSFNKNFLMIFII